MDHQLPERAVLAEFGRSLELDWQTGCWLWKGPSKSRFGHGQFRVKFGGTRNAHRLSWMFHKGPIPAGQVVCHRCDVPACVNPEHLFIGTQADNMRDMIAKGRKKYAPKKTHCVNGHAFTPENTFHAPNGTQRCKRCRSDAQLAYKSRNLEEVRTYQRERARAIRRESKNG
jgi:hypothetical protein